MPVGGDSVDGDGRGLRVGGEFGGDDGVHGEADAHARGFGAGEDVAGHAEQAVLDERRADLDAVRLEEGVGHAAAHEEAVELRQEVVDGGDLGADLGAADDGGEGTGRIGDERAEVAHLLLQQEAGHAGEEGGDARGGGVGAVGGPEGVVDVDVGERAEGGGEDAVVRLLFGVESAGSPAAPRRRGRGRARPRRRAGRCSLRRRRRGAPGSSASRSATGARLRAGSRSPFGRPRWEQTSTDAPFSMR